MFGRLVDIEQVLGGHPTVGNRAVPVPLGESLQFLDLHGHADQRAAIPTHDQTIAIGRMPTFDTFGVEGVEINPQLRPHVN